MAFISTLSFLKLRLYSKSRLYIKSRFVKSRLYCMYSIMNPLSNCLLIIDEFNIHRFTPKSDVWSFGVLLWEITSRGLTPYKGVDLTEVYSLLESGFRMEEPPDCPQGLYTLMTSMWQFRQDKRPDFHSIHSDIENLYLECDAKELSNQHNNNNSNNDHLTRTFSHLNLSSGSSRSSGYVSSDPKPPIFTMSTFEQSWPPKQFDPNKPVVPVKPIIVKSDAESQELDEVIRIAEEILATTESTDSMNKQNLIATFGLTSNLVEMIRDGNLLELISIKERIGFISTLNVIQSESGKRGELNVMRDSIKSLLMQLQLTKSN